MFFSPKNIASFSLTLLFTVTALAQVAPQINEINKPSSERVISLPSGVTRKRAPLGISEYVNNQQLKASKLNENIPDSVKANLLFPVGTPKEATISLLLSFDEEYSYSKMNPFLNDPDQLSTKPILLRETSTQSLDFWEGFLAALNINAPLVKFNVNVIDITSSDSVLRVRLTEPTAQKSNIIIGPNRLSAAKMVADYCKKNKIINVQPFISSMNIGLDNPYLVRLSPTIEGHMYKMFTTIIDSFPQAKVIINTSKRERDIMPALFIDSLFNDYNAKSKTKISKVFINTGDESKPAYVKDINTYIDSKKQNVIVYCSYEPSVINQFLRGINKYSNVNVFGMPTWKDDEIIRADYLNDSHLYFTDVFYKDSTDAQLPVFIGYYKEQYAHAPSSSAYLGFDIANYLSYSLKLYGFNFPELSLNNGFEGLGYNFNISKYFSKPKAGVEKSLQYYTNQSVRQFRIQDYQIQYVK